MKRQQRGRHSKNRLGYKGFLLLKMKMRTRMRMKEKTKKRSRNNKIKVSPFDRLPGDLMVSIFERISDAKSLCLCHSVSKSFAAHVVQTRFVSVEIPYALSLFSRCDTAWTPGPTISVWPPGVINFLKKLYCVESATIRIALRNPNPMSKPLLWSISDSFGFIFVFAESRSDDDTTSSECKSMYAKELELFSSCGNHLRDFVMRFRYIKELLVVLPNLKKISALDSMKQGSIVLGEQDIANIKKKIPIEGFKLRQKWWFAPEVKLPLSGCVMRDVTFILVREIGNGVCDDGVMVENLLEDNESIHEVTTMIEKRPDSRSIEYLLTLARLRMLYTVH